MNMLLRILIALVFSTLLAGCGEPPPRPVLVKPWSVLVPILGNTSATIYIRNMGAPGLVEIHVERVDSHTVWRQAEYFGSDETREGRMPLAGCPSRVHLIARVIGLPNTAQEAPTELGQEEWRVLPRTSGG